MNVDKIREINRMNIPMDQKTKMIQKLMYEPAENRAGKIQKLRSYHSENVLGCQHYRRKCKVYCPECDDYWTCRFCHDEVVTGHSLSVLRFKSKMMQCMECGEKQRSRKHCTNCSERMSSYFCSKCNLFETSNDIFYHCVNCKMCHRGEKNNHQYCEQCNACYEKEHFGNHHCKNKHSNEECPICFESTVSTLEKPVTMPCGHIMHEKCYGQYRKHTCPLCKKSISNMEMYNEHLRTAIERTPMPEEYNRDAKIYCNDCEEKSVTAFHFYGMQCGKCAGFNTVEV